MVNFFGDAPRRGRSNMDDVHENLDQLHPDAGILCWLEFIKERYDSWHPPQPR